MVKLCVTSTVGSRTVLLSLFLLFCAFTLASSDRSKKSDIYNKYKAIADVIIQYSLKNTNISKIEYLCDTFGPRFCGTPNLENAIDWIIGQMQAEGLENVRGESVTNITNWVRGEESLAMLSPRFYKMGMLGLGGSVGTSESGVIADVLVVSSFEELRQKASQAAGKIVVFNAPWVSYGTTVQYRVSGASEAAKVGALAALVRSVTPYSLYTVHTGAMFYEDGVSQIPTASITVEDSEMMARMQARGQRIVLRLNMNAQTLPDPVTSRNVLAEVVGAQYPDQYAIMGGHVDSWDVGQGAMDDGGGLFSAWEALRVLNTLILNGQIPRPKRTVRTVLWVNEELGARGADSYFQTHRSEVKNHVLAIESDTGNFRPLGFGFSSNNKTSLEVIKNISQLLASVGVDQILPGDGDSTDTSPLLDAGVPGMSLMSEGFIYSHFQQGNKQNKIILTDDNSIFTKRNEETKIYDYKFQPFNEDQYYFNYHHTAADTVTSLNPEGLSLSVASLAIYTYVVADLDFMLN